jgi:single-stranded DNA-binding protein
MILINVHGRLAHQPELKMLGNGGSVCEFRLLSTRFAKGEEVTEAVTFFCFDAEAEKFCETAEKGQLISASGTQETSSYTDANGARKSFTKYRMTWHQKGARPRSSQQGAQQSEGAGAQRFSNERQGGGNQGGARQAPNNVRATGGGFGRPSSAQGQQYQRGQNESHRDSAAPQQATQQSGGGFDDSGFDRSDSAFDDVSGFV